MAVSSMKQVLARYPLGRSTIYRLMQEGKFPRPRKLGRKNIWLNAELDKYEQSLPTASEIGTGTRPKLKVVRPVEKVRPPLATGRTSPAVLKPEAKQPSTREEEEIELPASLQK